MQRLARPARALAFALVCVLAAPPATAGIGDPPDLVAAGKSGDMALARDAFLRNDDPDRPDDDGNTALYFAIRNNHVALVRALLEHHAAPSRVARDGRFPLYWAAAGGHDDAVLALLAAGAKPDLLDYSGRDALGWAQDAHSPRVVQILRAAQRR